MRVFGTVEMERKQQSPTYQPYIAALWAMLVCALPLRADAQKQDPFLGANQFPQFRNLSGLAGGGYGLDSQGYPSLSGPTAFSTPIAYVLGHDHFWLSTAKASFSGLFSFGNGDSNGSGVISFGHTLGSFNIAFTDFIKSATFDQSYNLQIEYLPKRYSAWAISAGVQDWQGNGGAAGTGVPGDHASSRSIFGVVTYRLGLRPHPLYLSLGVGRHRFGRLFGSMSYQLARPIRVWLEEDGYGINTGLLFARRLRLGPGAAEFDTSIGLLRGRYFVLSVGVGF
jgi:hypothetical protein